MIKIKSTRKQRVASLIKNKLSLLVKENSNENSNKATTTFQTELETSGYRVHCVRSWLTFNGNLFWGVNFKDFDVVIIDRLEKLNHLDIDQLKLVIEKKEISLVILANELSDGYLRSNDTRSLLDRLIYV